MTVAARAAWLRQTCRSWPPAWIATTGHRDRRRCAARARRGAEHRCNEFDLPLLVPQRGQLDSSFNLQPEWIGRNGVGFQNFAKPAPQVMPMDAAFGVGWADWGPFEGLNRLYASLPQAQIDGDYNSIFIKPTQPPQPTPNAATTGITLGSGLGGSYPTDPLLRIDPYPTPPPLGAATAGDRT